MQPSSQPPTRPASAVTGSRLAFAGLAVGLLIVVVVSLLVAPRLTGDAGRSVESLPSALTQRIAAAALLDYEGRDAEAVGAWKALLADRSLTDTERGTVTVGHARALVDAGRFGEAIEAAQVPAQGIVAKQLLVQLHRAHSAAGNATAARQALQRLAQADPLIAPVVNLQVAASLAAAGQTAEANALVQAVLSDPATSSGDRVAAREVAASAARSVGNFDAAAAEFNRLESSAPDYRQPEFLYRKADALARSNRSGEADAALISLLVNFPESGYANLALKQIEPQRINLITPRTHALIHYYHGPTADALTLLSSLVKRGATDPESTELRLYLARTLLGSGQRDRAIQELNELRANAPPGPILGSANYELAAIREADGALDEAFGLYRRAAEIPARFSAVAAFRAGRIKWRQADFTAARQAWEDALPRQASDTDRNRLRFWAARAAQRAGQPEAATSLLAGFRGATDYDYYVARARSADPFTSRPFDGTPPAALQPRATDRAGAIAEADRWIASWAGMPTDAPLPSALDPILGADPLFLRVLRLSELGLEEEARASLQGLIDRWRGDPIRLYRIALATQDLGDATLSVQAHRAVLFASPLVDPLDLPPLLQRGLYPLPWSEALQREAAQRQLDPLLLAALIRQESVFDVDARSGADAFGLTQVIPTTGAEIARVLGITDYQHAQLARPHLAIRFGATYLRRMIDYQQGNVALALASYNGGAGNVDNWTGGNRSVDTDEFVERIPFAETQSYVKLLYQNYRAYRAIYAGK